MKDDRLFLVILCAACLGLTPAYGDDTPPPASILQVSGEIYREQHVAAIMRLLRNAAQDQRNLTTQDMQRAKALALSARRAEIIKLFFAADLDGNTQLSGTEISAPNTDAGGAARRGISGNLTSADSDGNGIILLDEAIGYAHRMADAAGPLSSNTRLQALFDLDPNSDGVLTDTELQAMAQASFRYYDGNDDGILSGNEMEAWRVDRAEIRKPSPPTLNRPARCAFPEVSAMDKVYLISGPRSGTLSNVTITEQSRLTETVTIDITEGKEPIYLVASSHNATIWQITGAVHRVSHFLGSSFDGAGVIGLPRDKVTIQKDKPCLDYFGPFQPEAKQYFDDLGKLLRHPIDGIFFKDRLDRISVPGLMQGLDKWSTDTDGQPSLTFSMEGFPRKNGLSVESNAYHRFKGNYPGGVVRLDGKQIVAKSQGERYDVLPQHAGLMQLMQDGTLEEKNQRYYTIRKPVIAFPGGWNSQQNIVFVLPKGMERPLRIPTGTRLSMEPD